MSGGPGGQGSRGPATAVPGPGAAAGRAEEAIRPGDVGPGREPLPDGRRLRRDRNRQAVVESLLDLYREGNLRPSSAEVAQRAGLSPRSLFRYFDDVDDLCRAAIERHLRRIRPLDRVGAGPGEPLAARVAALVDQRVQLYLAIGSVGVVSRLQAPFQPVIEAQLCAGRRHWREQVATLFGPELQAMGEAAAAVLAAADVLCSFESFQLLLGDQGLSPSRARAVLAAGLTALFGPWASPAP